MSVLPSDLCMLAGAMLALCSSSPAIAISYSESSTCFACMSNSLDQHSILLHGRLFGAVITFLVATIMLWPA